MALFLRCVLQLIPRTVITRKNNKGVPRKLQCVQSFKETTGLGIQFPDGVSIKATLGRPQIGFGSINDRMHHRMGDVEDKRFFRLSFFSEVLDRLVRIKPRQAGHVLGHPHLVIVFMEHNAAIIIGAKRPVVVVESLSVGHAWDDRLPIRYIPFPNASRLIPALLDQLGECEFLGRHPPTFASNGITPGKQRGSARSANGLGIKRSETSSLLRQLIQYRRFLSGTPVASQIPVSHVVDKNNQDIGLSLLRGLQSTRTETRAEHQDAKSHEDRFHQVALFNLGKK